MNVLEGLITIIQQKKKMLSKVKGDSGGNNTSKVTVRFYWNLIDTYLYAAKLYIDDELVYYGYATSSWYQGEEVAIVPDIKISTEIYNKLYEALSNNSCKFYFNDGDGENAGIKIIDGDIRFGETQGNYLYIQGSIYSSDNPIVITDKYKFAYRYKDYDNKAYCTYFKDDNIIVTFDCYIGDGIINKNDIPHKHIYVSMGLDLLNIIGEEIIDGKITTIGINMKSCDAFSSYGIDGSNNYYFYAETSSGASDHKISVLNFQ